jgi:hypothetical protein
MSEGGLQKNCSFRIACEFKGVLSDLGEQEVGGFESSLGEDGLDRVV